MSRLRPDEALPAVRADGLSVEDLGDEILIYDRDADTAHCLSASAALVWRACGRSVTVSDLIADGSIDRATVERAVGELRDQGLLEDSTLQVHRSGNGISRRQAVGRLAAAAAGPLVISVAAPTAWAQSAIVRTVCPASGTCAGGFFGCKQFSECVTGTSVGDPGKRECDTGTLSCSNPGRGCCPNGMRCSCGNRCRPATGPCPVCPCSNCGAGCVP
jgi:hypothetical protein